MDRPLVSQWVEDGVFSCIFTNHMYNLLGSHWNHEWFSLHLACIKQNSNLLVASKYASCHNQFLYIIFLEVYFISTQCFCLFVGSKKGKWQYKRKNQYLVQGEVKKIPHQYLFLNVYISFMLHMVIEISFKIQHSLWTIIIRDKLLFPTFPFFFYLNKM